MRIRSIKPEFWRSGDVAALPVEDRLLFVGLWSYVDDNGVGRDELAAIIGDLFAPDMLASPRETIARTQRGLERLETASLITRYTVDGRSYLAVTGWTAHQKIDRPSPGRYPRPDQADPIPARASLATTRDDSRALDAGTGEQGNRGTGENYLPRPQSRTSEAPGTELAIVEEHRPPARQSPRYPEAFERFWHAYPRHEGKGEALKVWRGALRSASEADLLAGAERYAADPNREPAFTAHASTWLRRRGWEDEPLPRRAPTARSDRQRDAVGRMFEELGAQPGRRGA